MDSQQWPGQILYELQCSYTIHSAFTPSTSAICVAEDVTKQTLYAGTAIQPCDHPETLTQASGPDSKSPYFAWSHSVFQLLHVSKSIVSSDGQPIFPATSSNTILWNTMWIAQIRWDIQNRTLSLNQIDYPGWHMWNLPQFIFIITMEDFGERCESLQTLRPCTKQPEYTKST
jgi:hypothetical protein